MLLANEDILDGPLKGGRVPGCMDDGPVLHVGEGTNLDVVQVPPQHAPIPDAHLHEHDVRNTRERMWGAASWHIDSRQCRVS